MKYLLLIFFPVFAFASPSSTLWAPSVATCQTFKVPHVTYDSYFSRGPSAGSAGAPNYPIDVGLTMGVLPFQKIQAEVGLDMMLPTEDPLLLNAKFCTPESSIFDGAPAIGIGVYNVGLKPGINDYNVVYLQIQKTMPGLGGAISFGGYYSANSRLLTNSDGVTVQSGFIGSIYAPDISVNTKGLKKVVFAGDIQTGKNSLGGASMGVYVFFNDNVALGTGPVWLFDKLLQPGGRDMLWTTQLDVDIPLE